MRLKENKLDEHSTRAVARGGPMGPRPYIKGADLR